MFRAIGNAFKAVLNSQIGRALVPIAICTFGAPACVAASAAITLATGGSIGDAVKAAAWSFAQVEIWTGVGKVLSGALQGSSALAAVAAKGLVHGTIGGALSVAQGGSFYEGFAANGIGGAVGMVTHQSGIDSNIYLDRAIVATAGGLSAEFTGGKFENGATTAAFANLFNKFGNQIQDQAESIAREFAAFVDQTSAEVEAHMVDPWGMEDCLSRMIASTDIGMGPCGGGGGGGGGRSAKGSSSPTPLTANQMNQVVNRGQAPKGIGRTDVGIVKGEQQHTIIDAVGAINKDGTWKHGGGNLARGQADWLRSQGYKIP